MNRRVRVLIVDDSATMRGLIAAMLRLDPAIDIVGEAGDAVAARRLIKELDPDVLTLDIEMPGMDGLEFLEKIMALRPMPVVIVSSATERAAATTVRALQAGAFECYAKPTGRVVDDMSLAGIVRAAAACPNRSAALRERRRPLAAPKASGRLIAIGASTGGVETLLEVLADFPKDCPPTVIVQHMPAAFTASFALRLNRFCPPTVCEVESGTILEQGHVYLAPGGLRHMEVVGAAAPRVRLLEGAPVSGHRPSVDVLFSSIARLAVPAVGILLTGMGADGAAGLKKMRDAGARTIGQDQASSVVYGMPQAARLLGAVEQELALSHIASTALEMAA